MKPNSLETLLQQDAPPPDPAARLTARRAALAEFSRLHPTPANQPTTRRGFFKALSDALRLSRDPQSHGREFVPWYRRRMLLGSAASLCLAVIGSTVVWDTLRHQPEVARLDLPASTSVTPPAEAVTAPPPVNPTASAGARRESETRAPLGTVNQPSAAATAAAGQLVDSTTAADAKAREDEAEANIQKYAVTPAAKTSELPVQTMSAEDIVVMNPADKRAKREPKDSDSLGEVIVTGARTNAPVTPHKGVAPAVPGSGFSFQRQRNGVMAGAAAEAVPAAPPAHVDGNDKFEHFELNSVKQVADEPVSTFSADVDTSSYSFIRKQLDQGVLPQKDAVRAEEMINYFEYSWPAAESREQPFRPTVVVSDSPWGKGRKLVHIGIKGYELPASKRPDANLVMLLDVSGSMDEPDKLPLVKQSMKLLLGSLKPTDSVAIVVYAGAAGMVLPPTPVGEKEKIVAALDSLTPGGSTAGAEGIELAYQLAQKSFRKEGVNRILLCTDGDFNVGIAGTNELKGYVERKRATGIYLSVLGFGTGNYRDELAQALAQNGNGVAAYIDTLAEAQKVLVQEAGSALFTIAKDVKFQVEFNPATVAEYRLVGYETRALKREDFNNDKIDAGDIGSGHTVTAIYEITPVGADARMVDESRYSKKKASEVSGSTGEYGFLKMRFKLPGQETSQLIQQPISVEQGKVPEAIQRDVGFSTAVAGFAQLLRGGQFTGSLKYDDVIKQALATRGDDPYGYRNEFVQLVRKAQAAR
jgi:Ca-activated chloride channel homolog